MRRSVDYNGRPQEQVSIEKITNKTSFSRGLEMISLAKLKRLDISATQSKLNVQQTSHGQLNSPNSPQDVNLKSNPADVQVSARNRPLVNCQNCSGISWVWSIWTVSWHGIEILQQLSRK